MTYWVASSVGGSVALGASVSPGLSDPTGTLGFFVYRA